MLSVCIVNDVVALLLVDSAGSMLTLQVLIVINNSLGNGVGGSLTVTVAYKPLWSGITEGESNVSSYLA